MKEFLYKVDNILKYDTEDASCIPYNIINVYVYIFLIEIGKILTLYKTSLLFLLPQTKCVYRHIVQVLAMFKKTSTFFIPSTISFRAYEHFN